MGEGADGQQPQSPGGADAAAARAPWAPHGRQLTACLIALNVFLVVLVYVYFWRFFSRAPRRSVDEEEDGGAASSESEDESSSPKARDRREAERAITALPIFVHSSSDTGLETAAAAAECAICIAEFADGEEGRLLPRCGHRFHAPCVDRWFRSHTTCPLCRATVLLHGVVADDAPRANRSAPADTATTTDSSECPV